MMSALAGGSYHVKSRTDIHPSAHAVLCLEAALWAFMRTDSFEDGLLLIVNMGDDSDTTGAVFGQLAGAYYGYEGIPPRWLDDLAQPDILRDYALGLLHFPQNG